MITADLPSLTLAKPEGLTYAFGAQVQVITNATALRQVLTSQALVDIVVSNDFRYDIRFYSPGNFSTNLVGGLYAPTGSVYTTFTIENPDASTNTYNRLRISESGSFGSRETEYVWSQATNQWAMTSGNGLRTETRSVTWDGTQTIRTETNVVKNAQGTVLFKQIEKYRAFDWGETNLIERVVDPGGTAPLTNTWVYYDNESSDGCNYGHLKQITQPTGYWERYEYNCSHLITKKVEQFLDAPITAPESECRVYVMYYGSGSVETHEYLLNALASISSTYKAVGERIDSQGWGELQTITRSYTNGVFEDQTRSVANPDGTMSLYSYAISNDGKTKTTTNSVGAAAGDGASITNGTKTITVVDTAGNLLTNQVYDIASGLLIAQEITAQADEFGRSTRVISLSGTNDVDYSCCGVESTVDPQGIVTAHTYDLLGRGITTTRAGITISNAYDAANRVIATFRNGTLVSSNAYDVAGRLISSTDALMHTTTYSETRNASNQTVRTTTYPDNSTRIETYHQDGQLYSVTGTGVHGVRYEYGVGDQIGEENNPRYTKEIKLNSNGTDTSEWKKTHFDHLGRVFHVVSSDGAVSRSDYDYYSGQLIKQYDPDDVITLFAYNDKGELDTVALDMGGGGIDYNGTDRISKTQGSVLTAHNTTVHRTTTTVYTTDYYSYVTAVSVNDVSLDGLRSWQIGFDLTNSLTTVCDRANAKCTVTATGPDGTEQISVYQDGRLQTNSIVNSQLGTLNSQSYQYDSLGRPSLMAQAQGGATVSVAYTYDAADQLLAVTNAVGTANQQVTLYQYDSVGRPTVITLPDNGTMTTEYFDTGEPKKTYGAYTYPAEYTYDYAGRMKTMKTWKNYIGNSGTATTTWNYNATSGFLTSKVYNDSSSVTYSNSPAGRLLSRMSARGITTTYAYNTAGDLGTITYSDSTPSVTAVYDRRGRRTQVVDGAGTHTFSYNDAGQLLAESFPNSGVIVTNSYDSLLRRWKLEAAGTSVTYGFDAASRLNAVTNGTYTAGYTYLPNSSLISNIVVNSGSITRMTTTKSWDNLNRLTRVDNVIPSLSRNLSFVYTYNSANQRTKRTEADSSYWDYGYDSLGQVTSGAKKWADGSLVAGQQYGYDFDDIGNRETTTVNGNTGTYTANSLNQYTQRTVPGYLWELGSATNNATVTINNQAVSRREDYFWKELSVANSSTALYTQLTTVAALKNAGGGDTNQSDIVTITAGKVFVAKSPEIFGYDSDCNLTNDGRFTYSWDAENRLVGVETTIPAVTAGAPKQKLLFDYDSQSRRVSKVVSNWTGSAWTLASNLKFVYDGWNLASELDATNGLVRSHVWGLDLSGSMEGAGGIGGLLLTSNYGLPVTNSFVAYDGNGNVMALVDGATGSNTTEYAYGPFGEPLRVTGAASGQPFRFSTKYQDDETELLYYGYRYLGNARWLSRDPSEEEGGLNLYAFVNNRPTSSVDPMGLDPWWTESFCDGASIDIQHIIFYANLWNSTSSPWSDSNQCGEQAGILAAILAGPRLVRSGCCGGTRVTGMINATVVGGHSTWWWSHQTQHHAVLIQPSGGYKDCCKLGAFILDPYKGNPKWGQNPNLSGQVWTLSLAEWWRRWPYPNPGYEAPRR